MKVYLSPKQLHCSDSSEMKRLLGKLLDLLQVKALSGFKKKKKKVKKNGGGCDCRRRQRKIEIVCVWDSVYILTRTSSVITLRSMNWGRQEHQERSR